MGSNPAHDIRRSHGARLSGNLTSVPEDDQGWNTANAELRRDTLFGLGIEFCQPHSGFQLGCRLFERRRHHLAGTTPGRPEIHDHWNIITLYVSLKIGGGQFQRMSDKQRSVTLAAARALVQACGRDAVDGTTLGTHDMK
jgi:hypothetical protein